MIKHKFEYILKLRQFLLSSAVWKKAHGNGLASDAIAYEISNTPNEERQERLWSLESRATESMELTDTILQHAEAIQPLGFTNYDALHLAFASSVNVDAFLSTDDKLLKRAKRYPEEIKITVANPLIWLQEVMI